MEHHTLHARVSVLATVVGVTLLAQLNVGDVAQAQHFAVSRRADYNVAEFLRGLQTPFVFHRVLVCLVGVLADSTGGRLNVLFCQCRRHIAWHEFVLCHHVGLHPYTHGVTTAQDHHLSYTLNTKQFRLDIDVDVVGQEGLVEGVVG